MGNIGAWEIALIVLVILLVFGPKRLPQMGRSLGRGMREFKETVTDQTRELKDATIDAPKEFKEALNPLAPTEKDEEPAKAPAPEAIPAPVAPPAEPAPVATPAEPVPAAVATPAEEKTESEGDKPS
jgi:sec-independent protein translocase protein TatA